ncbi:hypothetical protein [Dactylococcopsis salina]|uniref:Uncharacterized protein n=1 Tax=Dactylococcopsis salina (strain PCC 8305) TaxID=13035 RepID=K9YYE2_DACS8|nr:hypothetical protein [Dactylococcopsis salina]AFZ51128.1 hypothetical protein Dacsa_2539 [Dactylococcopsis salina PCC 8305]
MNNFGKALFFRLAQLQKLAREKFLLMLSCFLLFISVSITWGNFSSVNAQSPYENGLQFNIQSPSNFIQDAENQSAFPSDDGLRSGINKRELMSIVVLHGILANSNVDPMKQKSQRRWGGNALINDPVDDMVKQAIKITNKLIINLEDEELKQDDSNSSNQENGQ